MKWVQLYRQGWTMPRIARKYGVTPQRVQQVLAQHGITRFDGGVRLQHQASLRRQEHARWKRKEKHCRRIYGCSLAEYRRINGPGGRGEIASKYIHQRSTALKRGIEWNISLPEWWRRWKTKWHLRGRTGYVMTRKDMFRGFTPDNVEVTTHSRAVKRTRRQYG